MRFKSSTSSKELWIKIILFLCSLGIYFAYFHKIILNLNTLVSGITLDTLKNYYTYAWQIKNSSGFLHFEGMNYPYGEHIVYTDCQPLLVLLLKLMPFTHEYSIGILNALIFLSYIITPLIIYNLLRRLNVGPFPSAFASLGITLLAPQFLKIGAGHHGLSYAFMIPLCMLLIVRYLQSKHPERLATLFMYNLLLFFIHPYSGLSASLFSFISVSAAGILNRDWKLLARSIVSAAIAGLIPLLLFSLFIRMTDQHPGRTVEPYGSEVMIENIDGLLAPDFGPFSYVLTRLFPNPTQHFEGHSYLGILPVLLTVITCILLPFIFRKMKLKTETSAILIAGLLFLAVSFGLHHKIAAWFDLKPSLFSQFRASCRFAWFFYFTLPVFLLAFWNSTLPALVSDTSRKILIALAAVLIFAVNLTEAGGMFRQQKELFWKHENPFNASLLNAEEKRIIASVEKVQPQALFPLPVFFGGSEMYDRLGFNNSMIPALKYSYHTGIPVFSGLLSRTSIPETEAMIEALNMYKKDNPIFDHFNKRPFLAIRTNDQLLPDEERFVSKLEHFHRNDSLAFAYFSPALLTKRELQQPILTVHGDNFHSDSAGLVYIRKDSRKPFDTADMIDYEKIFVLDSNRFRTGNYVVSFHMHYSEKIWRAVALDLIVTRAGGGNYEWERMIPVRTLSGFYNGFAVFEYPLRLDKKNQYEFVLRGSHSRKYRISNFMLRPEESTVITHTAERDSVFNNFPE